MNVILVSDYPGTTSDVNNIILLADEYRLSAKMLMDNHQGRRKVSRGPPRLCAIQAIELYLNAFLLRRGETSGKVRSWRHDLAIKAGLAEQGGLKLRGRTMAHLVKMTEAREYLISRYAPEMVLGLSQDNRLMATLDEVSTKVKAEIARQPG